MTFKKEKKTITTSHPLEDFLNITPNSTEKEIVEVTSEPNKIEIYDDKDSEIDEEYQHIANTALSAYEEIIDASQDSKQPARMAEVAAQYLGIALDAINRKAGLKQHKDKLTNKKVNNIQKNIQNNLIIGRNDLLNKLKNEELDVIDGEIVEAEKDNR